MLNSMAIDAQPKRFCCPLRVGFTAKITGSADNLLAQFALALPVDFAPSIDPYIGTILAVL
jgi:hypothetical protein